MCFSFKLWCEHIFEKKKKKATENTGQIEPLAFLPSFFGGGGAFPPFLLLGGAAFQGLLSSLPVEWNEIESQVSTAK